MWTACPGLARLCPNLRIDASRQDRPRAPARYTPPTTGGQAMTRNWTAAWLLTAAMSVACGAGPAAAEWNFDLYGGAVWIQNSDLGVRGQDNNGASVNLTIFDLDTSTGF